MTQNLGSTLVVFYSRTGNTRTVANLIANRFSADQEELFDMKRRTGGLGYWTSVWDSLRKNSTMLYPPRYTPANYNLVIIGTPVWSGSLSSAILTYLREYHSQLHNVAFFLTQGGSDGTLVFSEMTRESKRHPLSTLEIRKAELAKPLRMQSKLDQFYADVSQYNLQTSDLAIR